MIVSVPAKRLFPIVHGAACSWCAPATTGATITCDTVVSAAGCYFQPSGATVMSPHLEWLLTMTMYLGDQPQTSTSPEPTDTVDGLEVYTKHEGCCGDCACGTALGP